jgi:hypothetical protein
MLRLRADRLECSCDVLQDLLCLGVGIADADEVAIGT